MPRLVATDTATRKFQYQILDYILYLHKLRFKFKKASAPIYSFCKLEEEKALRLL